jgi:hypothetical protein
MIAPIRYKLAGIIIVTLILALPIQAQTWRPVADGILNGISGMAIIEQTDSTASFLIVHDNKKRGESRAAIVTVEGTQQPWYTPLDWSKKHLPKDLEAITVVPEETNQFLALTSAGKVYHIRLIDSDSTVEVLNIFDLPQIPDHSNFEGLALQRLNGSLIAVWAHRGKNEQPGILYWTELDLATYTFSKPVHSLSLIMPWPVDHVRHISDLKVDSSGALFLTSTSDPGNNGPFASALYLAGNFQVRFGYITFLPSQSPVPLLRLNDHKVEAFDLLPGAKGSLIFGTDDENFGSFVYFKGKLN